MGDRARGLGLSFITHNVHHASPIGHRCTLLNHGRGCGILEKSEVSRQDVVSVSADPAWLWWQHGLIYQIYPRSFMDSNGDGVGDLTGIRSRLDYLTWLGVDAIWISPIFPSPMADFGYDVSDYTGIEPLFGSLEDFDALLTATHERDMRLLLDFVPNHSSDQHRWFRESRSSKSNPRRDWYLWRDPAPDGGPPNNWLSVFGGSAWEWDEPTGQFYYHAYLKEQPDLNWRNPAVRAAMLDVLRFWLERGVDGFRIDALRQVVKDDQFRDNPADPDWRPGTDPYHSLLPLYTTDRPEAMEIIAEWRALTDRYPETVLIGELYLPLERLVRYYGENGRGLQLPFNFHLILTPWQPRLVGALVEQYEGLLPPNAWPNYVLGNHDRHRLASRVGLEQARVAAMLLLTLRGTPTIYQGDELGMQDVPIPTELVQDPAERNVPGLGLGRDPERTPMQWDASPGGGFTTGTPWLPLGGDAARRNVAAEQQDQRSELSLYRALIELRRAVPALAGGSYQRLLVDDHVLVYARPGEDGRRAIVALNFSATPRDLLVAELGPRSELRLSTHLDRSETIVDGLLRLRANEGVVLLDVVAA